MGVVGVGVLGVGQLHEGEQHIEGAGSVAQVEAVGDGEGGRGEGVVGVGVEVELGGEVRGDELGETAYEGVGKGAFLARIEMELYLRDGSLLNHYSVIGNCPSHYRLQLKSPTTPILLSTHSPHHHPLPPHPTHPTHYHPLQSDLVRCGCSFWFIIVRM